MIYPSLSHTYAQAFKLFTKSYIDVFWFLMLLGLAKFAFNQYFPQQVLVDVRFFSRIFLDMCLSALFFGYILSALYEKHQAQRLDIVNNIKKGNRSFVDILLAYLFVSLPVLITLLLQSKINLSALAPALQCAPMMIALLMALILSTYCFLAGVFILNERNNVMEGIIKSCRLVHRYWVDTLLVVLFYGIIAFSLSFLLENIDIAYRDFIFIMLTSSLYPAVMLLHHDVLKQCEERTVSA